MRLNFLCAYHRRSLWEQPRNAKNLWQEYELRLREYPLKSEPSPLDVKLAGSALEAASIYLASRDAIDPQLLARYSESALTLIRMLSRLTQSRLAIIVLAGTAATLKQIATQNQEPAASRFACRRLTQEGLRVIKESDENTFKRHWETSRASDLHA